MNGGKLLGWMQSLSGFALCFKKLKETAAIKSVKLVTMEKVSSFAL